MPTSNVPFTYAIKTSGGVIHLYILVYSGSTAPSFPTSGTPVGSNTLLFPISTSGSGSTKHTKHYSFNVGSITDINISFNYNSGTKIKKLQVDDFLTDTEPSTVNGIVEDVPYGFTKIIDDDHFNVELVLISGTAKNFKCTHSFVSGSTIETRSVIEDTGGSTTTMEFSDSHTFNVDDFMTEPAASGANEISYGEPKKKRVKVKNKNHTPVPYPRVHKPIKTE